MESQFLFSIKYLLMRIQMSYLTMCHNLDYLALEDILLKMNDFDQQLQDYLIQLYVMENEKWLDILRDMM